MASTLMTGSEDDDQVVVEACPARTGPDGYDGDDVSMVILPYNRGGTLTMTEISFTTNPVGSFELTAHQGGDSHV